MSTSLALYFADGQSYFFGLAIVCMAVLSHLLDAKGFRVLGNSLLFLGLGLVLLSSIPAPIGFYGLWVAALLAWVALRGRRVPPWRRARNICFITVWALCLAGMVLEWSARRMPHLSTERLPCLYVIGDSLSAGMGGGETTWPAMLGAQHSVEVVNLARPGETTLSAMPQAQRVKPGPAIVLIEIGGNDFFADLPAAEFERHLENLLRQVHDPARRLVMFELPIPLLGHRYGYAQRRLAKQYGVVLIPRYVLARAIASPGATLDGLHFSGKGHQQMADAVWGVVQDAITLTQLPGGAT